MARHGQAADRFDLSPRPAGDRRVLDGDRRHVRADQSSGRHPLLGARSAHPFGRAEGMTVLSPEAAVVEIGAAPEARFAHAWGEFAENRIAVGALGLVVALVVLALLAPWITLQNPYDLTQLSILDNMLPPGSRSLDGRLYLLGTDDQGRDMLSAIIYGLRLSLFVGFVATGIALV